MSGQIIDLESARQKRNVAGVMSREERRMCRGHRSCC